MLSRIDTSARHLQTFAVRRSIRFLKASPRKRLGAAFRAAADQPPVPLRISLFSRAAELTRLARRGALTDIG